MNAALLLVIALAPAPTAIVDSVQGDADLSALQLLAPGTTVDLGRTARVRLAYFASCVHETVRGGRLRVGVTASLAVEGEIERVTADCAPPRARFGGDAVGALVLRDRRRHAAPIHRIRTATPLVLDVDTVVQSVVLPQTDRVYSICVDARCARVWLDPDARNEHGPILERVIRLP